MEKHNQQKQQDEDVVLGFVLLDCPEIGEEALVQTVQAELEGKAEIQSQRDKLLTWQIDVEGVSFWCACMPFPVPEGEVEQMTACNMLSQKDTQTMAAHKGFLVVGSKLLFTLEKKREVCLLFNRLCGGILKLEEAVGMYMGGAGLLIGKERYFRQLEVIYSQGREKDYFPVPLWIRLFLYQEKGRKNAQTSGLREFGFPEVCLYDTSLPPEEVIPRLYFIAMEEITGQTMYQDKDLIRLEDGREAVCKQEGEILYIIGT